jgi:predicted nucleic acid-binding protein
MNIVLDTNVFFPLCAGEEEPGRVYSKIIRDCDRVVVDDRIIQEYTNVLTKEGSNTILIYTKMNDLNVQQKLIHIKKSIQPLENIVTHEKDRHLIECAYAYNGLIITYETKHLINIKTDLKRRLNIDVLFPSEYLVLKKMI